MSSQKSWPVKHRVISERGQRALTRPRVLLSSGYHLEWSPDLDSGQVWRLLRHGPCPPRRQSVAYLQQKVTLGPQGVQTEYAQNVCRSCVIMWIIFTPYSWMVRLLHVDTSQCRKHVGGQTSWKDLKSTRHLKTHTHSQMLTFHVCARLFLFSYEAFPPDLHWLIITKQSFSFYLLIFTIIYQPYRKKLF